jgi:putative protein kinase ArgK-like GTPase of G3E family
MTIHLEDDLAERISALVDSPSKAFVAALAEFEKQNLEVSDADLTQYIFNAAVSFATKTLTAIVQLNPGVGKATMVEAFKHKVLAEMATVALAGMGPNAYKGERLH